MDSTGPTSKLQDNHHPEQWGWSSWKTQRSPTNHRSESQSNFMTSILLCVFCFFHINAIVISRSFPCSYINSDIFHRPHFHVTLERSTISPCFSSVVATTVLAPCEHMGFTGSLLFLSHQQHFKQITIHWPHTCPLPSWGCCLWCFMSSNNPAA